MSFDVICFILQYRVFRNKLNCIVKIC